jgi:hypothetical protein
MQANNCFSSHVFHLHVVYTVSQKTALPRAYNLSDLVQLATWLRINQTSGEAGGVCSEKRSTTTGGACVALSMPMKPTYSMVSVVVLATNWQYPQ